MVCNKEKWFPYNKREICKRCDKVKKTVKLNDPSDETKKYKQIVTNNEKKWSLSEQKYKCIKCFTSIWIKIYNVKDRKQFLCSNCRPNHAHKKYKYNKALQEWIPYRIRIVCKKCKVKKWIFTTDTNTDTCKKCNKKIDI